MKKSGSGVLYRLNQIPGRLAAWQDNRRLSRVAKAVQRQARPAAAGHGSPEGQPVAGPVVLFNATARIAGLSQTAAFGLLTGWSLRLAGAQVQQFACRGGMSRCVLGTDRDDFQKAPPCQACIRQSERLYAGAPVQWFEYAPDAGLAAAIENLGVPELSQFVYTSQKALTPDPSPQGGGEAAIPLGQLVLPSLRWALRRHSLSDDEDTRFLLRQYILSAYNVAVQFASFLDGLISQGSANPTVIIFNGIMFPEGTARWVAKQRGLRVVTYEVSFQPYSAFFTEGQATAYPIHIPDDFELSDTQNALLDHYLEKRFKGRFTMAGIRFWPEMRRLDPALLEKIAGFDQMVPVFTNVVYDTSQVHANTLFSNMFAWLEQVLEIVRANPRSLFVVRAHPDEIRPGTRKSSRETVSAWIQQNGADRLPNLVFIGPQEYLSSYELIERAKFVMVYNSSIGLEAALLGAPVLCAGKARYTQYPTVFLPGSAEEHQQMAAQFLAAESISLPPEFQRNARRFLYYQLFRASLSFQDFITTEHSGGKEHRGGKEQRQGGTTSKGEILRRQGYVRLTDFDWQALQAENHPALGKIVSDILRPSEPQSARFLLDSNTAYPADAKTAFRTTNHNDK